MRVLVTGASGLIGQRVVTGLRQAGHEVTGTSRHLAPAVDLCDAGSVARLVESIRPDAVLHCAANSHVDDCERAPSQAYSSNTEATVNVARACASVGSFLVHLSTDYIFDGLAGPYDIDAIPNPLSAYGRSKLAAELAVQTILPRGAWAIARTALVYGFPGGAQLNFGLWLAKSFAQPGRISLYDDQWVTPSLAVDVAAMAAEIATRRLPGMWHLAGADSMTRLQFGQAFAQCFGFDATRLDAVKLAGAALGGPRPAKAGLRTERTAAALQCQPRGLSASLQVFKAELSTV